MKRIFLTSLCLIFLASLAHADEIEYHCSGSYNSTKKADSMDPSTISISAKIDAVMLGDEDAKGDYKMETLTLKMTSSNLNNLDAGSITKGEFTGKMNKATTGKYKGMIRFDLGSPNPEAYKDVSENAPELYALIPTNDSNTVYIQRSGSGHDVYPAITLKCDN